MIIYAVESDWGATIVALSQGLQLKFARLLFFSSPPPTPPSTSVRSLAHGCSLRTKFGHLVSIGRARLFWREILLNLQKVNEEFPFLYHTPHHENMMLNGFYEKQVPLQLLQTAPCYLVLRRVELTIFWRTVGRTSTDHTNEFSWRWYMVDVKATNQATCCLLELVAPP